MVSLTIKLRFVIGSWVVLEVTISTISFFRLLQGGFRSHKRLKVLVLKNQQQRRQNPTPNQQMQHFLDFKTDTPLNS